jgi:hypothetical protein
VIRFKNKDICDGATVTRAHLFRKLASIVSPHRTRALSREFEADQFSTFANYPFDERHSQTGPILFAA